MLMVAVVCLFVDFLKKAQVLERALGVMRVEMNWKVSKLTTYTPDFLGLPNGIWSQEGGITNAGEDVVIGMIDTGIDPTHPSFSSVGSKPYGTVSHYTGICEVAPEFPQGSCNGKIIGAQHFAAAAIAEGAFNASVQFASPLDGDGHGWLVSCSSLLFSSPFLQIKYGTITNICNKKVFLFDFGPQTW
jgi:subtilisin family serine protease